MATTYTKRECEKLANEIAQQVRYNIVNDVNLGSAYESSYGGGEGTDYPKWVACREGYTVKVAVDTGRGIVVKAIAGIPEEIEA